MIKWGKKKGQPGNQPTGANPLAPSAGKERLIAGQELHIACFSAQKPGCGRNKRAEEIFFKLSNSANGRCGSWNQIEMEEEKE